MRRNPKGGREAKKRGSEAKRRKRSIGRKVAEIARQPIVIVIATAIAARRLPTLLRTALRRKKVKENVKRKKRKSVRRRARNRGENRTANARKIPAVATQAAEKMTPQHRRRHPNRIRGMHDCSFGGSLNRCKITAHKKLKN